MFFYLLCWITGDTLSGFFLVTEQNFCILKFSRYRRSWRSARGCFIRLQKLIVASPLEWALISSPVLQADWKLPQAKWSLAVLSHTVEEIPLGRYCCLVTHRGICDTLWGPFMHMWHMPHVHKCTRACPQVYSTSVHLCASSLQNLAVSPDFCALLGVSVERS